jgi:hypothetical protein
MLSVFIFADTAHIYAIIHFVPHPCQHITVDQSHSSGDAVEKIRKISNYMRGLLKKNLDWFILYRRKNYHDLMHLNGGTNASNGKQGKLGLLAYRRDSNRLKFPELHGCTINLPFSVLDIGVL